MLLCDKLLCSRATLQVLFRFFSIFVFSIHVRCYLQKCVLMYLKVLLVLYPLFSCFALVFFFYFHQDIGSCFYFKQN